MKRTSRIIELLRRHYPGRWTFEYPCYWRGERFDVAAYSESAATCEFDADSRFTTGYRRIDTGELVPELPSHRNVYYV